jgi:hypothetical protein
VFQGHELLELARESVILYLEDEDSSTRKAAAICCCRLVAHSLSASSTSQFSSNRSNRMGGAKRRRLVEEVCLKLHHMLNNSVTCILKLSCFTLITTYRHAYNMSFWEELR